MCDTEDKKEDNVYIEDFDELPRRPFIRVSIFWFKM